MTNAHNKSVQKQRRGIADLVIAFVLVVPVFISGCASMNDNVRFDLASQPRVYRDQWVRKSEPLVHVQPAERVDGQLTAVFVPFRVTQPISDPEMIGYTQARIIWQTWLAKRVFSVMEFDAANGPFRRDRAVALARAKGADLAIGGFVTYYNAGGSEAESQIALQVEIYDAASGQLIWSIAQSALMPARTVNDYIFFATETRSPTDPMYALTRAIAEDLAELFSRWISPVEGPHFDKGDGVGNGGNRRGLGSRPVHPTF